MNINIERKEQYDLYCAVLRCKVDHYNAQEIILKLKDDWAINYYLRDQSFILTSLTQRPRLCPTKVDQVEMILRAVLAKEFESSQGYLEQHEPFYVISRKLNAIRSRCRIMRFIEQVHPAVKVIKQDQEIVVKFASLEQPLGRLELRFATSNATSNVTSNATSNATTCNNEKKDSFAWKNLVPKQSIEQQLKYYFT